ncbi:hydroxymethylbilane synthase [bacterium]|jgi:hydroxymethylbilane synthase|nr:hydroxymethylbilane synthase [bacterium]
MSDKIRIGTRGSALALWQANKIAQLITANYSEYTPEIVIIETEGDLDRESPLWQIGGKGVFVKSLEKALLKEEVDLAVHSFKDLTSPLPKSLALVGFLPPETPSDAIVLCGDNPQQNVPEGGTLATGSRRREALINRWRPDIKVVPIRGNVGTRIKISQDKGYDGVVLSAAGLIRLGLMTDTVMTMDPQLFVPAPGQGVIAIESRRDDLTAIEIASTISHPDQMIVSGWEYDVLSRVGFDCQVPMGLWIRLENDKVKVDGFLSNSDGSEVFESQFEVSLELAEARIKALAQTMKEWIQTK